MKKQQTEFLAKWKKTYCKERAEHNHVEAYALFYPIAHDSFFQDMSLE